MTLYEIDKQIQEQLDRVDPETGEALMDFEALDALQLERDKKIENIACYIKNLTAEAVSIRAEEKALAERRTAKEEKAKRLKEYLGQALNGQKFESARAVVSWRQSERVDIDEDKFLSCEDNERIVGAVTFEPKFDKRVLKTAIKNGVKVTGAELVKYKSMTVK